MTGWERAIIGAMALLAVVCLTVELWWPDPATIERVAQ